MNKMTKAEQMVDMEELLALNGDLETSVAPRWARKQKMDRFIPSRTGFDSARAALQPAPERAESTNDTNQNLTASAKKAKKESELRREQALKAGLLSNGCIDDNDTRIIHYKAKAPPLPPTGYKNSLRVLYSTRGGASGLLPPGHEATMNTKRKGSSSSRHIPTAPSRVLDAPELMDDYYLNLVEWGANNKVAVALGPTVYIWNADDGGIVELLSLEEEDDYVCSVSWLPGETRGAGHLAVGTAAGVTELWDVGQTRCLRRMDGHSARISSLAWCGHILSSGGRDAMVVHHDVRIRHHAIGSCSGHTQEVCGLAWSPDGSMLASGANDNTVQLWSAASTGVRRQAPIRSLTDHCAAVKALAWCPHDRNVLATGAGTADRTIKLWNAQLGTNLNSIDTGSQVCALQWNPHEKELLSGHGYANNELALWSYPTMARIKDLKGHAGRVLSLSLSPDGTTALSAGADETLRFWQCFGDPAATAAAKKKLKQSNSMRKGPVAAGRPLSIR